MRFLLLSAAAFLLLVAPAKTSSDESSTTESPVTTVPAVPEESSTAESSVPTVPTDSDNGESIKSEEAQAHVKSVPDDESTTTESPETTVPTDKGESIKSEKKPAGPFDKIRRRLAQAQAELKLLDRRNVKLEAQYNSSLNQLVLLTEERDEMTLELKNTRNELREAQDTLKAERLQKEDCKPSETEMTELVDRETSKQVKNLERDMKQSYRKQYADLLNALRRKIDNALTRL